MKLVLEKPVYGGDCLGRLGGSDGKAGKAVFVSMTLPGEIVTAHVTEQKRSFAKAEIDEILTASPNRVVPQCPHFGVCGGCHYQHGDYPTQLDLKKQILGETLSRAGVAVPTEMEVLAGQPWGYRNRIRLAFTPLGGFGYRGRRSHEIVAIRECPIAAPSLIFTAERVAAFLAANSGPVLISEMELFANHDESQILLTLFCEKAPRLDLQAWLIPLHGMLPKTVVGVRLQLADGSLVPRILAASGENSLVYKAAGFDYKVDHGAFFQVNRWMMDDFVALITGGQTGGHAWDLYAGVGLFARQLTSRFPQVSAVESAPASFPALQRNLAGTAGRAIGSTTLDFLRHNREEREARPDLIVLDPPRAGLGEDVTSVLNAIGAPMIVYVSCDPATLARDLHALTQERYRIESVTLVDMFPQTFHLETVVKLRRS